MKKIFLLFLIWQIIPLVSFAYDDTTTHPGITEQTVELYNLNNEIKISSSDKELIIQGSIDEDSNPKTRPLNHFYDPVRGMGINDYRDTIDWVTGSNNGNEFTWGQSIEKYARGDREGALIGLGHILHLVGDMTVPDHTRNDPHMGTEGLAVLANTGNSSYENWAKENKNRETMSGIASYYSNILKLGPRRGLRSIENYLKNLAAYSNNNYVSADTIGNDVYDYPKVVEKKNGYAYGQDSYFYDKHKLYIEYIDKNNKKNIGLVNEDNDDYSVLEEYFTRLSKIAILSGAGVVEMFFAEAEEARAQYLEVERKRQEEIANYEAEKNKKIAEAGLFGKIWYWTSYKVKDTTSSLVGGVTDAFKVVGSTVYNGSAFVSNNIRNTVSGIGYTGGVLANIGAQKVEQGIRVATKAIVSTSKKVILYIEDRTPSLDTLAVAYAEQGASIGPSLTTTQVAQLIAVLSDLNGSSENQTAKDNEPDSVRRSSGGHHDSVTDPEIIEVASTSTATTTEETAEDEIATSTDDTATSTDDTATSTATSTEPVVDTEPPEFSFVISEPCLNSSDPEICLVANTTVDFSFVSSSTDIAFYTINIDYGDVIATTSENHFTSVFEDGGTYNLSFSATDISGNVSDSIVTDININIHPLIINEVAWMGTKASADDEWIELYNNTSYSIDLADWRLATADEGMNISLTGEISARSFYLLERGDDTTVSDIPANKIFTEELNDEGDTLILYLGSTVMDQTSAGAWPAGSSDRKASMERKAPWTDGAEISNWVDNNDYNCTGTDTNGDYIRGTPGSPNSSTVIELI
jgi:hypothetical protein